MISIRLRSSAALYSGNARGPKVSRNAGMESAGWSGDSMLSPIDVLVASEVALLRRGCLSRADDDRVPTGELGSASADFLISSLVLCKPCLSQYASRLLTFLRSSTVDLSRDQRIVPLARQMSHTPPDPVTLVHASKSDQAYHSSGAQERRLQQNLHCAQKRLLLC